MLTADVRTACDEDLKRRRAKLLTSLRKQIPGPVPQSFMRKSKHMIKTLQINSSKGLEEILARQLWMDSFPA